MKLYLNSLLLLSAFNTAIVASEDQGFSPYSAPGCSYMEPNQPPPSPTDEEGDTLISSYSTPTSPIYLSDTEEDKDENYNEGSSPSNFSLSDSEDEDMGLMDTYLSSDTESDNVRPHKKRGNPVIRYSTKKLTNDLKKVLETGKFEFNKQDFIDFLNGSVEKSVKKTLQKSLEAIQEAGLIDDSTNAFRVLLSLNQIEDKLIHKFNHIYLSSGYFCFAQMKRKMTTSSINTPSSRDKFLIRKLDTIVKNFNGDTFNKEHLINFLNGKMTTDIEETIAKVWDLLDKEDIKTNGQKSFRIFLSLYLNKELAEKFNPTLGENYDYFKGLKKKKSDLLKKEEAIKTFKIKINDKIKELNYDFNKEEFTAFLQGEKNKKSQSNLIKAFELVKLIKGPGKKTEKFKILLSFYDVAPEIINTFKSGSSSYRYLNKLLEKIPRKIEKEEREKSLREEISNKIKELNYDFDKNEFIDFLQGKKKEESRPMLIKALEVLNAIQGTEKISNKFRLLLNLYDVDPIEIKKFKTNSSVYKFFKILTTNKNVDLLKRKNSDAEEETPAKKRHKGKQPEQSPSQELLVEQAQPPVAMEQIQVQILNTLQQLLAMSQQQPLQNLPQPQPAQWFAQQQFLQNPTQPQSMQSSFRLQPQPIQLVHQQQTAVPEQLMQQLLLQIQPPPSQSTTKTPTPQRKGSNTKLGNDKKIELMDSLLNTILLSPENLLTLEEKAHYEKICSQHRLGKEIQQYVFLCIEKRNMSYQEMYDELENQGVGYIKKTIRAAKSSLVNKYDSSLLTKDVK